MVDVAPGRGRPRTRIVIGIAQLLLVVSAVALWAASRLPWVTIQSFDGLGPPREVTLPGGSWSTALLPVGLLALAAAVSALAVRGWMLRALAGLLALCSLAVVYLGVSLWRLPDVAVRASELAHVSVLTLVGSRRHYGGAVAAVAAGACMLVAAVLLLRSASKLAPGRDASSKYAAPATRRSVARQSDTDAAAPEVSERMIWDALDEGRDPTDRPRGPDTEGR
jgi:uncharacterized membrane protein (TIGR02234 family)